MLLEARGATRKVGRIGFRREDQADADMLAALRSGAAAVVEVARELDRLTATLSHKAALGDVAGDRDRFLATFRRIYLPQRRMRPGQPPLPAGRCEKSVKLDVVPRCEGGGTAALGAEMARAPGANHVQAT